MGEATFADRQTEKLTMVNLKMRKRLKVNHWIAARQDTSWRLSSRLRSIIPVPLSC